MSDPFRQQQFLTVLDRDEADRRFRQHLDLRPLEPETVSLFDAHQRVLAEDVRAPVDVPGFDRSNVDGFAVRAEDTFGASEDNPVLLRPNPDVVAPGRILAEAVEAGTATAVATGAAVPRGATAVVMIEHTELRGGRLVLTRPAAPGANVTWAGTDVGRGAVPGHGADLAGDGGAGRAGDCGGAGRPPAAGRHSLHRRRVTAAGGGAATGVRVRQQPDGAHRRGPRTRLRAGPVRHRPG